ncbi:MAG: flavodoxin-dependent (E)-4-hydroxy-3-methylbut-2-enyl-diphosphate synthase [Spirochaetales bacterium]|nr:flavodoxin-dependent (E)-4-hydroxy-3-methylbut-2-enyl-diphosphate synthase [Spirochaetales bacterium]
MRKKTFPVTVGKKIIGGVAPISVQTMWKSPLDKNPEDVIKEVKILEEAGCDFIRFAVPGIEDAKYIGFLAASLSIPVIADIHFDYRIALECMKYRIAKIRINPGNIGSAWKAEEVVKRAKGADIPIRVGINGGSLPKELRNEKNTAGAMIKAAERELDILEKYDFRNVVFSLKSHIVEDTVSANEEFAERYRYPLHLGVTEAGPLIEGVVKNAIALAALIQKGIGDTIRVSLSDSPLSEIIAGKEILRTCGCGNSGISLVSCPTCSRTVFDVRGFIAEMHPRLISIRKPLEIAVMGCPVNGPGEAKNADLGITGTGKYAVIFKGGKIIRKVSLEEACDAFIEEIEKCEGPKGI